MIYFINNKCFLVLVIYMFVMFYFFLIQKAENNRLKKASWPKLFCNIIFCFLPKVGSVGHVDQQTNFALPWAFPLKFICDHFYISILLKSIFLNWNITSLPYLGMLLINMIKLFFLIFLIDRNVRGCFL